MTSRSTTDDTLSAYGINPQAIARPDKYPTTEAIAEQSLQEYEDEQAMLDEKIDREMQEKRKAIQASSETE
jgi:hypothetical protein